MYKKKRSNGQGNHRDAPRRGEPLGSEVQGDAQGGVRSPEGQEQFGTGADDTQGGAGRRRKEIRFNRKINGYETIQETARGLDGVEPVGAPGDGERMDAGSVRCVVLYGIPADGGADRLLGRMVTFRLIVVLVVLVVSRERAGVARSDTGAGAKKSPERWKYTTV